jgi:hypothetical protein
MLKRLGRNVGEEPVWFPHISGHQTITLFARPVFVPKSLACCLFSCAAQRRRLASMIARFPSGRMTTVARCWDTMIATSRRCSKPRTKEISEAEMSEEHQPRRQGP